MKKLWIAALLCLATAGLQAQLLKKLKDKAQKVMNPQQKETGTNGNTNNPDNNTNNTNTNNGNGKQNAAKKDFIDLSACNVVFTLEAAAGERIMYDETAVTSREGKLSYSFVVKNRQYEYFLIEDGQRTGPFKQSPLASDNRFSFNEDRGGGDSEEDKVSIGGDKKDPVAIQYSKTISGKLHIVFNGKNYGPYDNVSKMLVSPDKKKFFAIVTIGGQAAMTAQMGMGNNYLVNEAGVKQKMGSNNTIPLKMKVSPSFKQALAVVMDNTSQKAITVSTTGKQIQADMNDLYSNKAGMLMVSDAGDLVTVPSQSPTQVLVNGNEAASFKVPITSTSRLFLLPDISKSVYFEKGRLYRGDGTEEDVSHITFPKVVTVNGSSSIYYYKMRKNEAGDTEVFLCSKGL